MLLQRALPLSLKPFRTLYFAALLARVSTVDAYVYCSRETFGAPRYTDCTGTLSAVPTDAVTQFFVEQQLRTGLPGANWYSFVDPRPVGLRKEVVQIPKWWSQGKSTLAKAVKRRLHCSSRSNRRSWWLKVMSRDLQHCSAELRS